MPPVTCDSWTLETWLLAISTIIVKKYTSDLGDNMERLKILIVIY